MCSSLHPPKKNHPCKSHPENRYWKGRTAQRDSRFPRTIVVPRAEINRSTRMTAKPSGEGRQPACAVSGKVSSHLSWISASRCICMGQHVTSVGKWGGRNGDDCKLPPALDLFLPPSITVCLTHCLRADMCPSLSPSSEKCAKHSERNYSE